ncbi:glycosyltransferase family 2 protein [Streptomyces platensis]|uniref:glycosyltransferase family 2 protein n=1 Tax=Streptomyces platensis TaxID=58346 RepID=UPI002E139599|nr:glycosyltransferase [Streptomyces platensis]WUB84374.1 glycosyltransferase [Streptomyces platensis]
MPLPRFGAILLTMNDRPEDFPRALDSLLAQQGVELEIVVVGNGVVPEQVPDGIRNVTLGENVGIPEGRNIGARALVTDPDLLFFFDNDAVLPETDTLARLAERLGHREGLTGGWGPRTPLRWRTVLRLTRAGRPPVV